MTATGIRFSVGWGWHQKAVRRKLCRQHYFVDVAVLGPGTGTSMFGVEPERLDRIADGRILQERLDLCTQAEVFSGTPRAAVHNLPKAFQKRPRVGRFWMSIR